MDDKRKNCIILLVDPPESGKANYELRTALGEERALHISADLMKNSYAISKNSRTRYRSFPMKASPPTPTLPGLTRRIRGSLM